MNNNNYKFKSIYEYHKEYSKPVRIFIVAGWIFLIPWILYGFYDFIRSFIGVERMSGAEGITLLISCLWMQAVSLVILFLNSFGKIAKDEYDTELIISDADIILFYNEVELRYSGFPEKTRVRERIRFKDISEIIQADDKITFLTKYSKTIYDNDGKALLKQKYKNKDDEKNLYIPEEYMTTIANDIDFKIKNYKK